MNIATAFRSAMLTAAVGALFVVCGCEPGPSAPGIQPAGDGQVPYPVSLLLPKEVRIHPFTGTRELDDADGIKGVEVRIEALDHYGDSTKAFGDFRFELYTHRPQTPDPKDERIAVWKVPLDEAQSNLIHWDNITRTYKFRLQWDSSIPVGDRFVLAVVFDSPFTQRLFDERVFIAGQ